MATEQVFASLAKVMDACARHGGCHYVAEENAKDED